MTAAAGAVTAQAGEPERSKGSSIAAVRAALSLESVLNAHGHSAPQRGCRMACPIHGGRNRSAFWVRDDRFVCFNCGARGDVVDLERALGGGSLVEAAQRLIERHRIDIGCVDTTTVRRRRRRLARLNRWWRDRSNEWTAALVATDAAVREWQCDPADADFVFWIELDRRCSARDICEAMVETFAELRSVELRANAFAVEQRGAVFMPHEAVAC